jgi:Mrp family chromosome partitioning ATPase
MGRTFETMLLAEGRMPAREEPPALDPVPQSTPTPRPTPADNEVPLRELPADAPFIEVGLRLLDASPDVMAATPTPAARPSKRLQLRLVPSPTVPVPSGTLPAEVIAYHDPAHPLAEQYRDLTAGLLEARPGVGPRTLAFTTALAGTSLTSVLLNLGVTAARLATRRIVVVEADLRQPTLAATLGLPPAPGLVEALADVVPLDQAVRTTAQSNLLILPAGGVMPESFALLRVDRIRHVIQRLALRADLVLLALPRWDSRPDVLALSACCDALFLVAPEPEADQPHVRELLHQLPALGAPLAGTVVLAA